MKTLFRNLRPVRLPPVSFLRRVVEILTSKDIDWMELWTSFLTLVIWLCLLAPGDYFGTSPRLHSLKNVGPNLTLPEAFWQAVFGLLLVVQTLGLAAGGSPLPVRVTRRLTVTLNPQVVRMWVMAVNVGVFGAMFVLSLESAPVWWISGVIPFPVSIGSGLFFGLAGFCFAASCRMAALVAKGRNLTWRETVLVEAESLLRLRMEVEDIRKAEEISGGLSPAGPSVSDLKRADSKLLFQALTEKGQEARAAGLAQRKSG